MELCENASAESQLVGVLATMSTEGSGNASLSITNGDLVSSDDQSGDDQQQNEHRSKREKPKPKVEKKQVPPHGTDEYWALERKWFLIGWTGTILPLINFYLMIFKPF